MNSLTSQFVSKIWRVFYNPSLTRLPVRCMSRSATGEGEGLSQDLTDGEKKIISRLHEAFPDATYINVADISGGCGAMYQISIESPQFIGKKTVMQHMMVNQALAKEIKKMHGLQLNTKAPEGEKEV